MKKNNIKISASILSADFSCLHDEVKKIEKAGVELIHIDVMDGMFVPNITIGIPVIKSLRKITKLIFDVHLMIEKPERYINDFRKAGSDIITVHAEACKNMTEVIKNIKSAGAKAGISINPATSVSKIKSVIDKADLILLMSVNPGFSGQKFMPVVLDKIKEVKEIINRKKLKAEIEVDGGVNAENSPLLIKTGVDILVSGSTIFNSLNIKKTVNILKGK